MKMIVAHRLIDWERVFLAVKNKFAAGCSVRWEKKGKAKQNGGLLKGREGFWLAQNWKAVMAQRDNIRAEVGTDGAGPFLIL